MTYNLKRGFTLIEILISMAIFTMVLVVITRFGLDISNFSLFFGETLEVQEELSKTMRVMTAELRTAGPADTGAYTIASATGSSITLYSDYDGDGKNEQIRYFMSGTTLIRGVTHSSGNPVSYPPASEITTEVIHNIVSSPNTIFSYYTQNYSGTEAPLAVPIDIPSIRLVKVTVTANQGQIGAAESTATISITIRHFRTLQ